MTRSRHTKKTRALEKRLHHYKETTRDTLEALETAASLGDFHDSLRELNAPGDILRETQERVRTLVAFQTTAFFLVDPASAEFRLADCHPAEQAGMIEGQIDRLIHDGVFAWALRERQPISVPSADRSGQLVLRAMCTRSKIQGMFVGILEHGTGEICHVNRALLSIVLRNSANALASCEMHSLIQTANADLERRVRERTRQLTYRVEMERLIGTLSSSFIHLGTEEIDRGIDQALQAIGEHLAASHGFVLFRTAEGRFHENAHEWHTAATRSQLPQLIDVALAAIPLLAEPIQAFENLYIPSWDSIPEAAKAENGLLEELGVQSLIVVPLVFDRSVIGVLGFNSVEVERPWPEAAADFLKLAGEIIVNALKRKWADEEKKKLEIQLQYKHKMEAVGTLAGGIAHDFNNLLMAIQGNASLMLFRLAPDHPHFAGLKKIERQVENGSNLTRQLLGYARKGNYSVAAIDLNLVLSDTLEAFGKTRKAIITHLELDQNLPPIDADPGQIEQLLLNLFVNAADAMPEAGQLCVKTSVVTDAEIGDTRYVPRPGRYVLLTVTDTGIGMAAETRERIFDPFFTTKEVGRGTGLGLASVYGIVKSHGGYIEVDSEVGRGTTFRLYFPISAKQKASVSLQEKQPACGNGTILFIDDELRVLDIGIRMLRALNYSVFEARDGFEGLKTFETHKDNIDLVVLDMTMPGLGGGEVFSRMKALKPDIKVLLASGYTCQGRAGEIMAQGCNGFIQKPFKMNELSGKILEILEN